MKSNEKSTKHNSIYLEPKKLWGEYEKTMSSQKHIAFIYDTLSFVPSKNTLLGIEWV